tara:strand:- start:461 stop:766 length:306 start_codon:yes stop_codon:yes gene_type:complete
MTNKLSKDFFIHPQISLQWAKTLQQCGTYAYLGIVLRYLGLFEKSDKISVTSNKLKKFGISKFQKLRALRRLEAQGLIQIVQHSGSNPLVKVIDPPFIRDE